jgi:hypothetical protein
MANQSSNTSDYLSMSDEELMKIHPNEVYSLSEEDDNTYQEPEPETIDNSVEPEEGNFETDTDSRVGSENDSEEEPEVPLEVNEETSKETEEEDKSESSEDVKEGSSTEGLSQTEVNYKEAYEKVFAPFKANGKEIQVRSPEDVIALMQMGANYNKKMATLKPNLKVLKLLENNNLLTEDKLSFLIDLDKKNPEAIGKLIKDSGLDIYSINTEEPNYVPPKRSVSDQDIELDMVLEDIRETPTFTKTLSVVGSEWDTESQRIVKDSPQLLRVINNHIGMGIYDQIINEVERQRIFGKLNGVSDIEAYRKVGDEINTKGGFDHLVSGQKPVQPNSDQKVNSNYTRPTQASNDSAELRNKKRAASSTRPAPKSATRVGDIDPLSLSDEDFSKLVLDNYL